MKKSSFQRISIEGYKLFRKNEKGELTSVFLTTGPFRVVYTEGKNYAPREMARRGNYITFFPRLSACVGWTKCMKMGSLQNIRTQIWKIQANYILRDLPLKFNIEDLNSGFVSFEIPTVDLRKSKRYSRFVRHHGYGWPDGTKMARNIVLLEKVNLRKCNRY